MVRALFVSACLFMVVGCGSGTSRRTASNPAQSDCYYYVENELCPTLIGCGATYSSFNECVNTFEINGNSVLACDSVTQEYGGLPACEAQTNQSYCYDVVDNNGYALLPPACYGVFN